MSSPTSTIDTQPMASITGSAPGDGGDVSFSRDLLDQIREGLVRFDQDLCIRSGNRSWLTMVGLDAARARGLNLSELLDRAGLENLRAALTAFKTQPSAQHAATAQDGQYLATKNLELSLTWRASDGRKIDTHTILFASREDSDSWVFSGLVHDLTVENLATEERQKLRERLRSTQKNESMGILAGGLAHDLNNVLAAILGLVDVARLQLAPDAQARPVIEEISKTADSAAILVRNLLAYARKSKQTTEIVDLSGLARELAQWVVSTLQPNAELEVSCAAGLPLALGDPTQLMQAMTNLVLNASEALPSSTTRRPEAEVASKGRRREPRIRIETGMTHLDNADLQRAVFTQRPQIGTYLFVEVWDNGCGIEPMLLPRIFDPFFTSKSTGRGLGLAAAQGIVYSHGGFLIVDTEPERGTSVRLYLPIPKPDAEPAYKTEAPRPPVKEQQTPESPLKILVVDDEEAVRGIAQATLHMAGYDVALAKDGQEGWDVLRDRPDDFAAVLLDITMPRMTGDELLAKVRELRPGLPVLLSSGFSSNEACFSTFDDPFTRFLRKPYRTRDLKHQIAELLALAELPAPD